MPRPTAAAVVWVALCACNALGDIDPAGPACVADGKKNGLETGVDCGGPCAKCEDGKQCRVAADCASKGCVDEVCDLCGAFKTADACSKCACDEEPDGCYLYFWHLRRSCGCMNGPCASECAPCASECSGDTPNCPNGPCDNCAYSHAMDPCYETGLQACDADPDCFEFLERAGPCEDLPN